MYNVVVDCYARYCDDYIVWLSFIFVSRSAQDNIRGNIFKKLVLLHGVKVFFHSSRNLTRKLAACENFHPITIFESTRCEFVSWFLR